MSKVDDTRDVLDTVCHGLEEVGKMTIELKRKADDAYDRTRFYMDRCWRVTTVSAEEDLNESVGRLGQLVTDAGATHALSCGVLDRDSTMRPETNSND